METNTTVTDLAWTSSEQCHPAHTSVQDKTEQDIRDVCGEILLLLRPDLKSRKPAQMQKLLTAPVNLGAMAR